MFDDDFDIGNVFDDDGDDDYVFNWNIYLK